ncbi:MAG: hypothetical protein AB7S26_08590 [Sandaracinaceae bacterium]
MYETPRQKWGSYIGLFSTLIPAMIVSNFMPAWNVLPFPAWLGIAALGGAIGGGIHAPTTKTPMGVISGALMGAGVLFGVYAYTDLRIALTGNATFFQLELVIGALLGAAPGALLYAKLVREREDEPKEF